MTDSKIRKILSKIKTRNTPTIFPLYYFFFSFGIIFLISLALFNILGSFEVQFFIAETDELVTFHFPIGDLISVILLGPVFSISSLRTFELLRIKAGPNKKSYAKRLFIISLYITFIFSLNIGAFSHMIANQLHEFIYEIELEESILPNTPLGQLKIGLYLWDEIISHILIGIGFFGMLYINVYFDLINDDDVAIRTDETVSIIVLGFILGAGIALGFIEGQAGFLFMFGVVFLIFAIPIIMKKNKLQYSRNPFVLTGFFVCAGYIFMLLLWIGISGGIKAYYPFLYQISELFLNI
ncbi:MAG: hypothetical protein ACTSWY_03465 [Promethearchaeota archaeon]